MTPASKTLAMWLLAAALVLLFISTFIWQALLFRLSLGTLLGAITLSALRHDDHRK